MSFSKTYGKVVTILSIFLLAAGYSLKGNSAAESNNGEFEFSATKMSLSDVGSLAEKYCPNEMTDVILKNPHRIISISSRKATCEKLAKTILMKDKKREEKTFDVNFNNENIETAISKIYEECPLIRGTINIKKPTFVKLRLVSNAMTCAAAKSYIEAQYLAATTVVNSETIVNNGFGTSQFSEAVGPNLSIPRDLKSGNAELYCNSNFSVSREGKAFDIKSKCDSDDHEAAVLFEHMLVDAISITQFKPKVINEKLMTMTNISIHNNFVPGENYDIL